MAIALARDLRDRPISLILSSPLSRAIDTAIPLSVALGIGIQTDPRLKEFDFGAYEGRSKKALGLSLRKSHAHVPVPGGEALIDVWNRAGLAIDALLQCRDAGDGEIVIFGHFWINRMLYGHAKRLDFDAACRSRDYRPETGSAIALPLLQMED